MNKTKLNFGSGADVLDDFFNVDLRKMEGTDKVFDFNKFPYPLKDNQFEYVKCNEVLEHLLFPDRVLDELWRVCKDRAIIEINVPYVGSKSAYCNLQHKSFFNDRSFTSLDKKRFEIIELKIETQRYLRLIPKKIINILAVFLNNIYVHINVKIKVKK